MPDFGRWTSNGGDPSLNEINRSDRFLDALATEQPVYATDASEAELISLLSGWRDEIRQKPLSVPVTPRDAVIALDSAQRTRRSRRTLALVGSTEGWLRYRLPDRYIRRERTPLCIGQKQRWFLLQLTTDRSRVRFDLSPEPEFDRCRWVDYWRPVKEVVYFKRPVYVRALHELGRLAFPHDGPPPPPAWWPRRWQRVLSEHGQA